MQMFGIMLGLMPYLWYHGALNINVVDALVVFLTLHDLLVPESWWVVLCIGLAVDARVKLLEDGLWLASRHDGHRDRLLVILIEDADLIHDDLLAQLVLLNFALHVFQDVFVLVVNQPLRPRLGPRHVGFESHSILVFDEVDHWSF